jgi:hypothetical protein
MTSTSASACTSAPVTTPARVLLDRDHAGRFAVVLDHQRLDVQHDVGDVLQHAGNRRELVLRAADLDLRDGAALRLDSRIRRRLLPMVTPNPRSNGSATNLP